MKISVRLLTAAWLAFSPAFAQQSTPTLPDGVNAHEWSEITSLITAERYQFSDSVSGHGTSNEGLRAIGTFDGRSGLIEARDGAWQFGLALSSYGFDGEMREVGTPEFGACVDGQELSYGWTDEVSEWWINDARGFEHGFHVWQRPGAGDARGPLTFNLDLLGTLQPEVKASRTGLVLRGAGGEVALQYDGLFAVDARGVQLDAWLETGDGVLRIAVDESRAEYPLLIDPIVQQAYLKPSNTDDGDAFGLSVSLSGDTLVVGAYGESSAATGVNGNEADNSAPLAGAAYVFVRTGGSWVQQAYLKASNSEAGDGFGVSASISGDTLVVGAPGEDSFAAGVNGDETNNAATSAGAAYVFVRAGSTWSQQAYLKASNTERADSFGFSAFVSDDTIVIGAYREDGGAAGVTGVNGDESDNSMSRAGAAYVFVRAGDSWSQQAYLKAPNAEADDEFGRFVSVSGGTVVVGSPFEDSAATGVNGDPSDNSGDATGAAYVYSGFTSPGIGDVVCVGAENSTGFSGNLAAAGSPVVAAGSLSLEITCCPALGFGLVVTTSSNGDPIQSAAVGDGTLCIANSQLGRFPAVMIDATGAATQSVDLAAIPTNLAPAVALPGDTYYFQFWHRDAVGGVATSNLTSAISVLFE